MISVPIGLMAAIYLVEYGNKNALARSITFLVDVMTGIPSIVAGLFAFAVFTLAFGPAYVSGLGGSVALSLLMIPIVVRATEEMLMLVPSDLREAAYALGTPKWKTIVKVVLPTALGGILTGITLAISRVIGETAPLLLIAGAATKTNWNLFEGGMTTLPVYIYGERLDGSDEAKLNAWGAALGADRDRDGAQPRCTRRGTHLRPEQGLKGSQGKQWPGASTSPTSTSTTATSSPSRVST